MFVMVDYVREMTVTKSFMANMDLLSICSSFFFFFFFFGCCFCLFVWGFFVLFCCCFCFLIRTFAPLFVSLFIRSFLRMFLSPSTIVATLKPLNYDVKQDNQPVNDLFMWCILFLVLWC